MAPSALISSRGAGSMGMAVLSALCSSRIAAIVACLMATGCAAGPPALPPPRMVLPPKPSADPATCGALVKDLGRIDRNIRAANARIEAERPRNQAVGYFAAVLFPPLLLAAEDNSAERSAI